MAGLFDFFRGNKKENTTASVARDRLQVIVAHERQTAMQPDWMPKLQQELLDVIQKYVEINTEDLKIEMNSEDDMSVLEISVDWANEEKKDD